MFGFDPFTLFIVAAVTLLAFFVRGLSGFGSSLVGVGALSMVLPPAQVVPTYLALELLASLNLLPGIWRHVDWRALGWVVAGSLLGAPLGLALLAWLDPDLVRLLVSASLLVIAFVMLTPSLASRLASRAQAGPLASAAVGLTSGVLNGLAAIGGPPVIVYFFARASVTVGRATVIAFILLANTWVLLLAGSSGVLAGAGWQLITVALPFALIGIWLGQRGFARLDDASLRRLIWRLLAALGAVGLLGAAWRLVG
ncbi:sulfite exporter TauE/SafE family protein [Comamonadaceae bacterium G21597-S1]|nr:sulfite exporter TauE/SafE family protein [Comamonadaceae bacterium G21597-S1]